MIKLLALAGPLYFVVLPLARLVSRRRFGFPIPFWVHAIAAGAAVIAVLLAWQSQASGGTELWRDLLMILILPTLMYLGYGFYGALYVGPDHENTEPDDPDA